MLLQRPDGVLLSDRAPFAWVDTNVMVEIVTFGDIIDAKRNSSDDKVEERRVFMQGSLWMATLLAEAGALTQSYAHEWLDTAKRHCPVGTDLHQWAKVTAFLLDEGGLFQGWTQGMTNAAEDLGNGARDTFMVDECARWDMKLISRDKGAHKKARARAVEAFAPEEWAEQFAPRSLVERYFMRRLSAALKLYSDRCPPEHRVACDQTGKAVRALYEYIWRPSAPAEPFSAESMFR